ncbi:hypothetical protein EYF80_033922 [Liparis tanakae]|uniref:Uncharacterized protein n=1 Tax=Liparis tanakae TaxID=230148 RepID=A0A4Z2GTC0_9TELE|nr:hypothetical protein EYF80_033922 [Liparis tanakae]
MQCRSGTQQLDRQGFRERLDRKAPALSLIDGPNGTTDKGPHSFRLQPLDSLCSDRSGGRMDEDYFQHQSRGSSSSQHLFSSTRSLTTFCAFAHTMRM